MPIAIGTLQGGNFIKKLPSPYTEEQVKSYLNRIEYPRAEEDGAVADHLTSLENLTLVMRLHLLAFPFENTAMHYTPEHKMDVSYQGAFNRLVLNKMGSYCYGQNSAMLGMLRGLGYRVYPGHARVNGAHASAGAAPQYGAKSHMVLFVQPIANSNETYIVDVGFGSPGLARPILLSEGTVSRGAMAPEMHTLGRRPHPQSSIDAPRLDATNGQSHFLWTMEMFHEGSNPPVHQLMYTFSEEEIFPPEMEQGSFGVSQQPEIIFGQHVLCCKYVRLSEDRFALNLGDGDVTPPSKLDADDDSLVRYTLFGGQVKRVAGGSSTVIQELTTEAQRIQALREVFGLNIPDEAEKYIQGRIPAFSSANAT